MCSVECETAHEKVLLGTLYTAHCTLSKNFAAPLDKFLKYPLDFSASFGSNIDKRLKYPGGSTPAKGGFSVKSIRARYQGSYLSYVLIYFFYFVSMSLFSSVLSVYLTGIGKSAAEMSFIVSAAGLFSFVAVPVTGYLTDRTKNPKLISGLLLFAAGTLGMVFSACRSLWALFLLDGCIMSSINSVMPICERMASASKFRYGTLRIWGTFGYAAGAQTAGLAIEHFPSFVLFSLLLCSCFLTIVGFLGTERPAPNKPTAPQASSRPEKPKLSSLLKNPSFLLFLVIAFLFSGCSGVNMNYAPILLGSMGVPTGAVGTVLFFSTLVEIPLILFSNKFMDRFSGKTLMLASFLVIVTQFLFYSFAKTAAVVVAVMILLKAIASTLFVMIVLKIVRNLVDPEFTTTGLSVVNAINNLASILMQNVSGAIVDRAGVQTLYLCLTAIVGLGVLLTLFLRVENRETVFS